MRRQLTQAQLYETLVAVRLRLRSASLDSTTRAALTSAEDKLRQELAGKRIAHKNRRTE